MRRTRILHVEIGGTYGGSLRALELYLAYSDRARFSHHLLYFFPTPGAERLEPLVEGVETLYPDVPKWLLVPGHRPRARVSAIKRKIKNTWLGGKMAEASLWMRAFPTFSTVPELCRRFTRGSYDLIHVNSVPSYYSAAPLAASRLARIPAVSHVRSEIPVNSLNRWQARSSASVIAINHTLERQLSFWLTRGTAQTCYDAAQVGAPDDASVCAIRSELLDDGNLLVGSVGRLVHPKGFEFLVRAARQVVNARPDVRFAIAGEGPLGTPLQQLIADLNLENHFRLYGFRSDVSNFLSALDVFVCSSIAEGGPLTVAEAMLLGKPVVATEVGFVPDVVLPEFSGLLVRPSDPAALAAAILRGVERTRSQSWPSEQIRAAASRFFDPLTSARAIDSVMEAAVSNRRSVNHVRQLPGAVPAAGSEFLADFTKRPRIGNPRSEA